RRAEEILLVKEAAIASSINAIAMSDLHGRLNYVNEAFLKMWGLDDISDVLGQSVTAFWVDKEQAGGVAETLFDKGSWVGEMTAIRRDNSRFEAQVSAHLVKGTDGQPVCMMSSFLDITERKKAENELRKLSQAVEQSANAIVITNTEGNIEYANPKFVEVSGYSLSEVLRETPRILNSGEHSPEFYRNLWQTIKAGRVWRGEVHNRRKDGTLYWEDSTITPVFDSDHKLVNFIAIKEDITARKALEEAERSHRRLAEALRDTSAALNSTLKLDEVLDRVLENIEKVTTFDAAMVLMVEGHTVRKIRQLNKLQTILGPGLTGNTQANLINVPILQTIRETQQPCLIPDTHTDLRWHAIPGMSWIRSLISAPVMIRGQVAGVINILSATPNAFTPSHSERLMVFAGQAAVAIENAQLFEQAYYLSVIDPLTELTNRRHFFEAARFEFERTHRYPRTLSVMMIDIDHFKNINDTHGHAVGDAALREVAARIKRSVRTVDIVARYGGEEFIVLMPETGLQKAGQVAERVRRSVANNPIADGNTSVTATLSIGVAEMDDKSRNIDQLIVYADKALYEAKAAGRNRVASYRNG
ncbi:MAG: diguanylate cyclase, partial [Anaerolineales bacterium]|nr:diguanylate cyclase [Anaerolineales bacterium]